MFKENDKIYSTNQTLARKWQNIFSVNQILARCRPQCRCHSFPQDCSKCNNCSRQILQIFYSRQIQNQIFFSRQIYKHFKNWHWLIESHLKSQQSNTKKLWSSSVSRKNIPTISPPPGCIQQPKAGLLPQPAVQDHLLRAQRPLHLKWICTDGEIVLDVCTGACHNLTQIRFSNVVDPGTWWHSFQ